MTLDTIITQKPTTMPSNSVLKKHAEDSAVQQLFSRKDMPIQELLPDDLVYKQPAGSASWKESHFVEMHLPGNVKIPYVLKTFNETMFAKLFGANAGASHEELMVKELLGGNPNSLEGLAYSIPKKLKDGQLAMLEEALPTSIENTATQHTFTTALTDFIGFAKGLRSLHSDLKIVWGDGKPEHFRYDLKGKPKLNDFGTMSVQDRGIKDKKRTGDFLYSAPETFSRPRRSPSVDVFSFGAVAYYALTGKDLHEQLFEQATKEITSKDIFSQVKAYAAFMKDADVKQLRKYYKKQLKKVPREFRKTLFEMINPKTLERIADGSTLVERLEQLKERLDAKLYVRKQFNKHATLLAAGLAISGLTVLGAYTMHTAPVITVTAPEVVVGDAIELPKNTIVFDVENNFKEQPRNIQGLHRYTYNANHYRSSGVRNYQALALAMGFDHAYKIKGIISSGDIEHKIRYRHATFTIDKYGRTQSTLPPITKLAVAQLAEHNLGVLSGGTGVADFEDLHVRTVLSKEDYSQLRNRIEQEARNGNHAAYDFTTYKDFKTAEGNSFFTRKEKKFLETWIQCSYQVLLKEDKNLENLFTENSKEYYLEQKKLFEQNDPANIMRTQ